MAQEDIKMSMAGFFPCILYFRTIYTVQFSENRLFGWDVYLTVLRFRRAFSRAEKYGYFGEERREDSRSYLVFKDFLGRQFLTIEAAETLCTVCIPPEEHIFRKKYLGNRPFKRSHFIRV